MKYHQQRGLSRRRRRARAPRRRGTEQLRSRAPDGSRAARIAFILPDFARPPVPLVSVGIYRYLGGKRWQTMPDAARRIFFHIGL